MEQNLPMVAKRMWRIVRVAYFMLRKGLCSKRKLLLDLNMFMKRGKLAGKAAMTNLMTLHVHAVAGASSSFRRSASSAVPAGEYEFSCSNTPVRGRSHHASFFACAHAPPTLDEDADVIRAALELINAGGASPALLDLGQLAYGPTVRQLRITDSPFPLRDADEVDSRPVDEAAEAFIRRFYKDLSRQSLRSPLPN